MRPRVDVLTFPRDPNPYQQLLHDALAERGVRAEFLAEPTPSASLNSAALLGVLAAARLRGASVLHLHWVWKFAPPWAVWLPRGRRVSRAWFALVLRAARALGYRVVWTAHNVLPHTPVFDDDVAARRHLVRAADAIIVHGPAVGDQLVRDFGADAGRVTVVPHGPFEPAPDAPAREAVRADLGVPAEGLLLGLVGRIDPYKGADDLLEAVARLDDAAALPPGLRVLVAGSVKTDGLRAEIERLARGRATVTLRLGWLTEAAFSGYVGALDLAVLPFRRITTSGSAVAALSAGVPVAVPEGMLPDLPAGCVIRFTDLTELLRRLAADPGLVARARAAAEDQARDWTWARVAEATAAVYQPKRTARS